MISNYRIIDKRPKPPPIPVYTIDVQVSPAGQGVVTGAGEYEAGSKCTVSIAFDESDTQYTFSGWFEDGEMVSEETDYSFTVTKDRTLTASFVAQPLEYPYTGEVVEVALLPGLYKLEVWGAEGGYRSSASYAGKGGYSVGELTLRAPETVFVRAGGSGRTGGAAGGFNGGGRRSTYYGGGGASDIRIGEDDFYHRVIVAGGGGSDGASAKAGKYGGGTAGGDVGSSGSANGYGTGGYGGTQTGNSGGSSWQTTSPGTNVTSAAGAYSGFGFGGNGISLSSGYGGAGGGGWYGGSGRVPDSSGDDDGGGGGGSGFVWTGENAPSGFGLTEDHQLANAQTIGGNTAFTSPDGASETGHSGDGYVRITTLALFGDLQQYTISVSSENEEMGAVSGGGTYYEGQKVTVAAIPASGYTLAYWMENGEQVSTDREYTFTASGDRALVAVFEEKASGLPDGYTELEYIQSGGTQCINTGIIPGDLTTIEIDIQPTNLATSTNNFIFGSTHTVNSSLSLYKRFCFSRTSNGLYASCGSSMQQVSDDTSIKRFSLGINVLESTAYVDGEAVTLNQSSDSFSNNPSIYLLSNIADTNSPSSFISAKLYSCKIYNGAVLERDFCPCKNQSGVVGLYDIVGGQFYANAGSGTFTAGPEV